MDRNKTNQPKTKKYRKVVKKQQPINHNEITMLTQTQVSGISDIQNEQIQSNFDSTSILDVLNKNQAPVNTEIYKKISQVIEDKNLRSLKKHLKKTYKECQNIQILYSQTKPMISFSYDIKGVRKNKQLKQLLKQNKQICKQKKIIEQIFSRLYNRIGSQYSKMIKIISILSQIQRVQIKINKQITNKHLLLYFKVIENSIRFCLFDQQMRIFQFDNTMIQNLNLKNDQSQIWHKFYNSAINQYKQKLESLFQQIGQNQASSEDQQSNIKYEQKIDDIAIKEKIKKLVDANLDQYENQIQEKENQIDILRQKQNIKNKNELEKIKQQLKQLQINLQNYRETAQKVKKQLEQGLNPRKYGLLLKKMILVQKQLQSKLPIIARKKDIFNALNKQNLIILEGETGSGKSTQLPQIMCQYLKVFQEKAKQVLPILITQPRKLATRTVAQRVASQMEQKIKGFVDYSTSSLKSISPTAKIIFKLDTVVLDQITNDRTLSKYSCLIIDQAHQRTISIDVILGLIKQLQQKRPNFKVIVTSASLDATLLQKYFGVKIMKVSGRLYPVQIIYKDMKHELDTIKRIQNCIKNDILVNNSQIKDQYKGDILVFCSGVEQINILCNIFHKFLNPNVFKVYPLHGRLAVNQQKQIFMKTTEHKIIFSSRISQTSITIDGVKVVVDPGYDRQQVYDQKNRVTSRKLINISQSSAKQRAGRAGRTSSGYCLRLYSETQFKNFRLNKTPQIQNMALDTLVLRLKLLGINKIFEFNYIKKPENLALQKSVQTLQMIGALDSSGKITLIGKLLLQLKIQPFLGRAIVEAILCQFIINESSFRNELIKKFNWKRQEIQKIQNIKQQVVMILSMVINSSNLFIFLNQYDKNRALLDKIKFQKFSDTRGDFFYLKNIYNQFDFWRRKNKKQLNKWIQDHFLNKKTLYQTKQLRDEILQTIKNFKFDKRDPRFDQLIINIKDRLRKCKSIDDIIISCMMTSFCINLSLYSENPQIGYTLILHKKPIVIYGTSTLALQSRYPKWIICYQIQTNDRGITYCQIAHQIDFKFLKSTVDDYVFDALGLKQAQKVNPFYNTIKRCLPTVILQNIRSDYINRDNIDNNILKYFSIIINEDRNEICLSYRKDLKIKGCDINERVQQYIQNKINDKKINKLNINLTSNIFIQLNRGFIITNLFLTSRQIQLLIQCEQMQMNELIQLLQMYDINYNKMNNNKLIILILNENKLIQIKQIINNLKLKYKQIIKQKQQIYKNKIYMIFYNGKLQNKSIFMYYGRGQYYKIQTIVNILHKKIKQILLIKINKQQQKYKYFNILKSCKFQISQNYTGIKCYNQNIDGFQLKQTLQILTINNFLPFNFQLPLNIRQYRKNDSQLVYKQGKNYWESQILKVFNRQGFKDIKVKVKGNDRYQQEKSQKFMKYELTAEITAQNSEILDKLSKNFDGEQNMIGLGKIHFRYNYKQHIIKITKRIFQAFKDYFDYIKDKYNQLYMGQIKIEIYQKIFNKINNIFISCSSSNRYKLLQPSIQIKQLFTPYLIRLKPIQFNYLQNSDEGELFLRKLQQKYDYKIYFSFQRKKNILKIYCDENQFEKIEQKILNVFQQYSFYIQTISYKAKGLKRVVQVIQKYKKSLYQNKKKIKDRFLEYIIIFRNKQIKIQGDKITVQEVKNSIINLLDQISGSCFICQKNPEKPYKLLNCNHQFCFKCLGDYLEQCRKQQSYDQIICPQKDCKKAINSHDIRSMLSTQQFENLCMKRLKKYVASNNKKYFFCPTSGCEQIFQYKNNQDTSFDCYICGKWYCYKCLQPHEHFTCDQWESMLDKGELEKFGYKKCKCGNILQKQTRNIAIKCKSCSQYLCWNCKKSWKDERDCQKHTKSCKR